MNFKALGLAGIAIVMSSAVPALAHHSFAAEFDKDQKVTKVEGREEFLKRLGQANQTMEPLLKKVLNEEALKQMADPAFGMLPGKPVGKGDSWTRDSKLSLGPIGSYKNTHKYTVEKIEKGIVEAAARRRLAAGARHDDRAHGRPSPARGLAQNEHRVGPIATHQAVHAGPGQMKFMALFDSHALDTNLLFLHRGVLEPKSGISAGAKIDQ
jgi:hypothetical protein